MADPGSLVGAVSLGIQVLQGIKVYYGHFSSYHDDIETIVAHTTRLEAVFRVLERPIQESAIDGSELSEEIWNCMAACLRGLQKLDDFRRKCANSKYSPGKMKLREQIGKVKKRVSYPFRTATLENLRKELGRLSENLQTAIQALQLCVPPITVAQLPSQSADIVHRDTAIRYHEESEKRARRHHDENKENTNISQGRLSRMANQQAYQTELIETLDTS
jgi:hypothetical protein